MSKRKLKACANLPMVGFLNSPAPTNEGSMTFAIIDGIFLGLLGLVGFCALLALASVAVYIVINLKDRR